MKGIDLLIRDDMKELGRICPKCHAKMKLLIRFVDKWYCPNKKCGVVLDV